MSLFPPAAKYLRCSRRMLIIDALCTITSGWILPETGSLMSKKSLSIGDIVRSKTKLGSSLGAYCFYGFIEGGLDRSH